jgi:hypothetical protein
MTSSSLMLFRSIAMVLVFAVMQTYVLAGPATTAITHGNANVFTGLLILTNNQTALVNGNSAPTGTTIFTGSQLQTPEMSGATVQLGRAGHLRIASGTTLTLNFDRESVEVKVLAGDAVLTTGEGVKGSVIMPDGKVKSGAGKAPQTGNQGTSSNAAGLTIFAVIVGTVILFTFLDDDDES